MGGFLAAFTSGSSLCTFGTTDLVPHPAINSVLCLHTRNQRSLDGHGWIDEWSDGQTDGWMDVTRMKARLQQGWWSSRVLSIGKQTVRSSQWRPAQWCEKIIIIIVVILIIMIVLSCS